jgi:hypothetical protein
MTVNENGSSKAAIVFTASLTRKTAEARLPPTYVGLRRLRPSSRIVQRALSSSVATSESKSVYKVVDAETGQERRMTRQEKRGRKQKEREQKLVAKTMAKQEASTSSSSTTPKTEGPLDRYMQLEMDANALKEELADIRGERNSFVPPVCLSAPLTRQAMLQGIIRGPQVDVAALDTVYDDDLSSRWAAILKQSMKAAETVRRQEDLRELPYVLNPEVWTRMRPPLEPPSSPKQQTVQEECSNDWSLFHMTPDLGNSSYNADAAAVIQLLYRGKSLHVSCGAKFGSDYLIYDGPRGERHAFAGLRLVNYNDTQKLPIPSAYDMTGYVRGLNTAGKLALLATVVRDGSTNRVAIVDLALEKVADTTFSRRSGKKRESQHLSKK